MNMQNKWLNDELILTLVNRMEQIDINKKTRKKTEIFEW